MAVNTLTKELNALLTTTLEHYRPTMADNVFRSHIALSKLMDNDNVRRQAGGNEIVQPLMYGRNDTVKSYSGYEKFDTTPQDGITAAEYDWKQIGATVSISRKERRVNSGKEALFNLLEKKVQQAEMSIKEVINEMLVNAFTAGNSGKDLTPFHALAPKDPSGGTASELGDIDGADHNWWRSQNLASTASSQEDIKTELYRMYNLCSRQGLNSKPDLIMTDQITYENYELALDDKIRYVDEDTADLGFEEAIRVKGATMVWDEVMPDVQNQTEFDTTASFDGSSNPETGTAMFLNTDFIEFVIDSETEFENTDFQQPTDQDAALSKILFMGELCCANRQKQGVLYDINRV